MAAENIQGDEKLPILGQMAKRKEIGEGLPLKGSKSLVHQPVQLLLQKKNLICSTVWCSFHIWLYKCVLLIC